MEQLNNIEEKIKKREIELADLKDKRKDTESKIFETIMNENRIGIKDVIEILSAFGKNSE